MFLSKVLNTIAVYLNICKSLINNIPVKKLNLDHRITNKRDFTCIFYGWIYVDNVDNCAVDNILINKMIMFTSFSFFYASKKSTGWNKLLINFKYL